MFNQNDFPGNFDPVFPFHIQEIFLPHDRISFDLKGINQVIHLKKGRFYYMNSPTQKSVSDCSLILIPAEINTHINCAGETELTRMVFKPFFLKEMISFMKQNKMPASLDPESIFIDKKINTYHLNRERNSAVYETLFDILQEYIRRSAGYRLMIRMKFAEFLLMLNRIKIEGNPVEIIKSKKHEILDIINYIRENYYEAFHLNDLAQRCGMNPTYFSRAFKEQAGMPLFQYLNHIRIKKACQILKRTNIPIIEIAYEIGYQNISFFNRCFKKIMQMSPREYRHMIQK